MEDKNIPGNPMRMSKSVREACELLADAVQNNHGTKNGRTALYWHLFYAAQEHAARPGPEEKSP